MSDRTMECPTCNEAMNVGEISLDASIADLVLSHGGAVSTLRFQEPSGKAITVMHEADSKPALHCESCGYFLVITDPEYTDTKCVVCKTLMPAGTSSCPKCGWTYKEN